MIIILIYIYRFCKDGSSFKNILVRNDLRNFSTRQARGALCLRLILNHIVVVVGIVTVDMQLSQREKTTQTEVMIKKF